MRNQVMEMGQSIKAQLRGAERLGDQEIVAHAELLATLVHSNLKLGFAACAHREIIRETGAMLADRLATRERMIDLHERLAGLGDRLGIDPRAFGDSGKEDGVLPPATGIHLVERQVA